MSAEGFGTRSSSAGLIAEGLEGLTAENIGRVDRRRMAEGRSVTMRKDRGRYNKTLQIPIGGRIFIRTDFVHALESKKYRVFESRGRFAEAK